MSLFLCRSALLGVIPVASPLVVFEEDFADDTDLANWTFTRTPGTHDPSVVLADDPAQGALVFGVPGDDFAAAWRDIAATPGQIYQARSVHRLDGTGSSTADVFVRVLDAADATIWESADAAGASNTDQSVQIDVNGGAALPANAAKIRFYYQVRGTIGPTDTQQMQVGYVKLTDLTGGSEAAPSVSEFTYRGVTVTLSSPLPVIYTANGDPVIISSGASSITSITPDSTNVNATSTWANGTVKNPVDQDYDGQGFDELSASDGQGASSAYTYDSDLNIDPGATGTAIDIAEGDAFSLVKAVRRSTGASLTAWKNIEKYVVITVMPADPGAGTWFRPAVSGATKAWEHRVEDLDYTVLRQLALPAGQEDVATIAAQITTQDTHTVPMWHNSGDKGRRMQVLGETGESGYTADYAPVRAREMLSLFGPETDDEKESVLIDLVQRGIDAIGAYRAGLHRASGAGQHYGYIEYPYLAGFALQDQTILDDALGIEANAVNQVFWVDASLIGYGLDWDAGSDGGDKGFTGIVYTDSELGIPEWAKNGWEPSGTTAPALYNNTGIDTLNASLYGSYRSTEFDAGPLEVLAIGLLQNGPSDQTGDAALRGGDAYGTDNIRSAALAYIDRSMTWTPYLGHVSGNSSTTRAIYDAWRSQIAQTQWTGRPDISQTAELPEFSAGASSGEIDWNFSDIEYATEMVTSKDLGYSLDNIQFIEQTDVADTGTLTGLEPAVDHYCRWRQTSASGSSPWSPTWPMELRGEGVYLLDRNKIRTPGTAGSGAPVNVVAPVIHHRPYPDFNQQSTYYEPVTDADGVVTFYAGAGYFTGGSPITFSYQWQRDTGGGFADISGATGQSYDRQSADSGNSIRCNVTATTPGGAVTEATAAIAIPAAATIPAATLIDTDFQGESAFDYPTIFDTLTGLNGTFAWLYDRFTGSGTSRGALAVSKTAAFPRVKGDITAAAAAGTYSWEADVAIGYAVEGGLKEPQSGRTTIFRLQTSDGATRWVDEVLDHLTWPRVVTISGSFTITAGAADKSISLDHICNSNTGGTAGGDPFLTRLSIVKTA